MAVSGVVATFITLVLLSFTYVSSCRLPLQLQLAGAGLRMALAWDFSLVVRQILAFESHLNWY